MSKPWFINCLTPCEKANVILTFYLIKIFGIDVYVVHFTHTRAQGGLKATLLEILKKGPP